MNMNNFSSNTVYTVYYTLHSIPGTVYDVHYTVVHCRYTLYTTKYTVYNVHCTYYTIYNVKYTYTVPLTLYGNVIKKAVHFILSSYRHVRIP